MNRAALVVEVADTTRGERTEYVFARSPVRVGRSPLNELPLEHGFVSHCHGLLHFDETHVAFIDVGSTNGSFLQGARLEKNRRVPVSSGSVITIGSLRIALRLELRHSHETRASYAFAPSGSSCSDPALAVHSANVLASTTEAPARDSRLAGLSLRFAQSFLELRRGQQQLLRDLGVAAPNGDALLAIDDPHELLAYLLAPGAGHDRIDELSRAYADLMSHQLAMVSAISAGSRALLEELSPHNLAPRGVGGLVGFVARLLGRDARWNLLQKRTEELHEETALSALVFGRSFARAYAAALGKTGGSVHPPFSGAEQT